MVQLTFRFVKVHASIVSTVLITPICFVWLMHLGCMVFYPFVLTLITSIALTVTDGTAKTTWSLRYVNFSGLELSCSRKRWLGTVRSNYCIVRNTVV